ncbi:nitronate monooxygenase family protein [Massilia sp. TS11]|uniref:NAD(P)H-dependent flavin oxidoreductase n=1 Tax=Massilia sp. TS11 TaxID=2908003 RepID=UPI001EDB7874|nr:nitronate monooxygenase [Massilia sp. TS11]MCG2583131.1 nitronate monooxygenase [Massilia sp. TS11]
MNLTERLRTKFPLLQAPMAGVQDAALCIAVSRAGGLGALPAAMLTPEALGQQLAAIAAAAPGPYNVNFFCHQTPTPDPAREQAWRAGLGPYYAAAGIDPAGIAAGPGRAPFSAAQLEVIAAFRPPVVSFHFGLPEAALLARVKAWGALVLASATTLDEGQWLVEHGADVVIAQGLEAGGHRGHFLSHDLSRQMGTFALLPQLAQRLPVPVVAAGGIADAAGVRAAMVLGAAGVQVGTAYLLADEARTSAVHRQALQSPRAAHTALTNLFTGRPARGIVNRLMRELGPLSELAPAFPLATAALAPLRAQAEAEGSGEMSPLWAGQNAAGCRAAPAAVITATLAQGFAAA